MDIRNHPLEKLRETAIRAARAAGDKQLAYYGRHLHVDALHKHDLKLEVDRLCEQAILETIAAEFPDHAIIAEESGVFEKESEYVWFIDPLDGTVNFYHGIAHFCSCIACYYRGNGSESRVSPSENGLTVMGEPLVGVVYAPIADELFVGVNGQGATRNDTLIQVHPQQKLCEAVVGISFGSNEETMRRMERITSILLRCCHKVRILGSCGLDIANIACGRLGALVQQKVHCWDFAASRIILEEAGGAFDAVERGQNTWNIVACIPDALEHLKKVTRRVV